VEQTIPTSHLSVGQLVSNQLISVFDQKNFVFAWSHQKIYEPHWLLAVV